MVHVVEVVIVVVVVVNIVVVVVLFLVPLCSVWKKKSAYLYSTKRQYQRVVHGPAWRKAVKRFS